MLRTLLQRSIGRAAPILKPGVGGESSYPSLLLLCLLLILSGAASAERLRISPDDLRLRVAVSEELPPSLRREVKELARSTPLPVENGLLQTDRLIEGRFGDRGFSERRGLLLRYYFLVARLDQSQTFSDEFLRRETLLREGIALLNDYVDELNRLIARAIYSDAPEVRIPKVADFPLQRVERTGEGDVVVLHRFAAADAGMGRQNLRRLREAAHRESDLLQRRLETLLNAEEAFLVEVSHLGRELIKMRPSIREVVRVPGEGLPFSR